MACTEFEDLILDYCDGAASPADSALLESHIAACTACRAYLAEQQELDLRLAKSLPQPELSANFRPLLDARIDTERRAPRFEWLPRLLDGIGYVSLSAVGGYLLQQLPHFRDVIGIAVLSACAAYGVWETGKALRATYGHR